MTLKIYGRSTSYNVQKVLWFLDELGLQYEHLPLGGKYGGLDTAEYAEVNPFKKIPSLVDDGCNISESNTILRYLAASYGAPVYWCSSPVDRAAIESWMDWSIDVLEQAFVGVFWGYYRTPEQKRDWEFIETNKRKCQDCLAMIEKKLIDSEFLASEQLSIADISVGVFIYRLVEIDLGINLQSETERWYRSLGVRRGYHKWVMSDFSELKGRVEY